MDKLYLKLWCHLRVLIETIAIAFGQTKRNSIKKVNGSQSMFRLVGGSLTGHRELKMCDYLNIHAMAELCQGGNR